MIDGHFEAYRMRAHGVCKICRENIDYKTDAIKFTDPRTYESASYYHIDCFRQAIANIPEKIIS